MKLNLYQKQKKKICDGENWQFWMTAPTNFLFIIKKRRKYFNCNICTVLKRNFKTFS